MKTLLQDLRYGIRMLAKAPGFAVIAILTLALGIGANTALFSVVNGVLLNPLPYAQPDQLVALYSRTKSFAHSSISYPNFLDWERQNHSFSDLAAFRQDNVTLTGMGEPERLRSEMVSATFFPLLGVKPAAGRLFRPDEDKAGAAPVALISAELWSRKFGSAPDAVGKSLTLNGTSYTVVGVIPGGFRYQSGNFHRSDIYTPIGQWTDPAFLDRRIGMGMDAVGRLKPGVSLEQAQADMNTVGANLAAEFPDVDKDTGISLFPLKQDVVGSIRPFLLVLLAAVALVLLIACANVANLLLARSTGRTREFAIRAALGATQGRVIRQLLTESLLLACAGGGLGLLLAAWGTKAGLNVLPEALPRSGEIHLDGRVLLFTLAASLLAGIIFGLAPALKTSRADIHETLKEGGRGGSGVRHGTQRVLVVVEMAMAVVLLIGAGLMIRSLGQLWSVNPGFDPHHVTSFSVSFPASQTSNADAIRAFMRRIDNSLTAIPGVEGFSWVAGALPMQGDSEIPYWLTGQPKPASDAQMKEALMYLVGSDYMKVMKIPLLRGRFLTAGDNEHSPDVIVIDQDFARLTFGDQDPIGQRVSFDILGTTAEIVGVVGHVKQWGLDENANSPVQAQFYAPIWQVPDNFWSLLAKGNGGVARTAGSPDAIYPAIRHALEGIQSQSVMYGTETMDETISDTLASRRFAMILLGVFAALALLLSAIGIYGVISYLAGQRTHEIGVRMALGAQRSDVLRLVLRQGMVVALVGVAIGIVAALGLMRFLGTMLFGVSAHDPLTFAGVALVLSAVACAACYFPARRAMRVDPMIALRYE